MPAEGKRRDDTTPKSTGPAATSTASTTNKEEQLEHDRGKVVIEEDGNIVVKEEDHDRCEEVGDQAAGAQEAREPGDEEEARGACTPDQTGICGVDRSCGRWRSNWLRCGLRRLTRA